MCVHKPWGCILALCQCYCNKILSSLREGVRGRDNWERSPGCSVCGPGGTDQREDERGQRLGAKF